jgi:catechol 2,3-dioxygenase-like lactoylglutathione lyase family enzyme
VKFWTDVLGFSVIKEMVESGPHVDAIMGLTAVKLITVKLRAPLGGVIELLHFKSHRDEPFWDGKPYSTGLTHIAMTVKNLDELIKKLNVAGAIFFDRPQYAPDGSVKLLYCVGPEGLLIELVEEL